MGKQWTDRRTARKVADAVTDTWLKLSERDRAALQRQVLSLSESALDCPECEVCCAIGLCCPPGSEQQRNALASLLFVERT